MLIGLSKLRCPFCLSERVEECMRLCSGLIECLQEIKEIAEEILGDALVTPINKKLILRIREITKDFSIVHHCKRCNAIIFNGLAITAVIYGQHHAQRRMGLPLVEMVFPPER